MAKESWRRVLVVMAFAIPAAIFVNSEYSKDINIGLVALGIVVFIILGMKGFINPEL